MGDEPIREYESHTEPFDEEHLATARRTLTKAQSMDWLADGEAIGKDGHKTPCIPANDLEWLFGYVDSLRATLAAERRESARLREELDYDPDDPAWGTKNRSRGQLRRKMRGQHKAAKRTHEQMLTLVSRIESLESSLAAERVEGERLRELARQFVEMADVRVEGIGDMAYFDAYHDARMPLVVLLDELDAARPPSPTEEA